MKKNLLIIVVIILIGLPVLGMISGRSSFRDSSLVQTGDWVERGAPMMGYDETSSMDAAVEDEAINTKTAAMGIANSAIMPIPINSGYDDFTPDVERTIVKNASLSLIANNTQELVNNISHKIKEFDGLVTNSSVYENDTLYRNQKTTGAINASMTLRVPADNLDMALAAIKAMAERVTSENISASDETESKVDMQAQLSNLKASETQLLKIMESAKTVPDTLQVQRELNSTRNQIERLEARLDNLEGAAAMSTININISTKESELPVVDPDKASLSDEIKIAFKDAINLYRDLSIAGIRLLILGLPVLVVGGIAYLLWKRKRQ